MMTVDSSKGKGALSATIPSEDNTDMTVHKCRFIQATPSAIVALAQSPDLLELVDMDFFSATQSIVMDKSGPRKKVLPKVPEGELEAEGKGIAVAKANGDIEIWRADSSGRSAWFCERVIPGGQGESGAPECLAWTASFLDDDDEDDDEDDDIEESDAMNASKNDDQEAQRPRARKMLPSRLFSGGLTGFLSEYDMKTLQIKRTVPSNGGAIWCMAANPQSTILAAGCEDGFVRLYSLNGGGPLEYMCSLEKVPGRILGLSWHPDGIHLIACGSKSSIYKFNTQTKRRVQTMRVDTKNSDTIVWCVSCVGEDTIASGDSIGNVCFWHWGTGTLKKCIKSHQADVLCLAVNGKGQKVFSSGVDRKVIGYSLTNTSSYDKRSKKHSFEWIQSGKMRYHSHDVRALLWVDSKPFDALFSGGMDATLTHVAPASEYPKTKPFRQPCFPHKSIVSLCPSKRLILARFPDSLKLWELGKVVLDETGSSTKHSPYKFLINCQLTTASNLICSAIAPNGQFIACSDSTSTKIFEILHDGTLVRKLKAVDSDAPPLKAAHVLDFTPDSGRLLCGCLDGSLSIVELQVPDLDLDDIETGSAMFNQVAIFTVNEHLASRELVSLMSVSSDGQWLAVTDLSRRISIYNLDRMAFYASLPRLKKQASAISFHPDSNRLITVLITNEVLMFDVEKKCLDLWSKKSASKMPQFWHKRQEIVMGISVHAESPDLVTFYAPFHLSFLNTGSSNRSSVRSIESAPEMASSHNSGLKRVTRDGEEVNELSAQNEVKSPTPQTLMSSKIKKPLEMDHRYQSILFAGYLGGEEGGCASDLRELVVIERPILAILQALGPAFSAHKYGS